MEPMLAVLAFWPPFFRGLKTLKRLVEDRLRSAKFLSGRQTLAAGINVVLALRLAEHWSISLLEVPIHGFRQLNQF